MALGQTAQAVYNTFKQGEADIDRLAEAIATSNLAIAGDEQRRLSGSATLSRAQIRAINRAAIDSARSIVSTYNTDLLRQLVELDPSRPDRPARNQRQVGALIRAWETARDRWKLPQIASHEQVTTRRAIFAEHIARVGGDDLLVQWEPKTAAEPYCARYVARGPMPAGEAIAALAGTHIGCVHMLRLSS